MIGWFSAAVIGAFRSLLFRCTVPSYGSVVVVVILDRGHPCFRNFYSTIPVDVVRVTSYENQRVDSQKQQPITAKRPA